MLDYKNLVIPKGKVEHFVWDGDIPGFAIRLRIAGSMTYVFQYLCARKQRRMTIGRVNAISPSMARRIASLLYHEVRMGGDPQGVRYARLKHRSDLHLSEAEIQDVENRIRNLKEKINERYRRYS